MTKLLHFAVVCILTTLTLQIFGQDQIWQINLKEKLNTVSWIEQSNDGVIIASGDLGMIGVDNNTGEVLWFMDDVKAADRSTYYALDGLPIFYTETSNLVGKTRSLLVQSTTGEVIFDTKEMDIKIGDNHIFPSINCIIFEIAQDEKNKLMAFDYLENKILWNVELGDAPSGLGALIKGNSFLTNVPQVIDAKKIMINESKRISIIDFNNGDIMWQEDFKDRIKSANYSLGDDNVYVGTRKDLAILDGKTGKDITPDKVRMKGSLDQVFMNKKGNVILIDDKGFNILDVNTKEFEWKKPYNGSGISDIWEMDNHYYQIIKSESGSEVAKITKSGDKVWSEKIAGYAYFLIPIDQGIFYLSTDKSNVLSYSEGEKLWRKDIKFKSIPAADVDEKNNKVVFFEDKDLFTFDLGTTEIQELSTDVKFDKVKDAIFNIEARPEGYFISSDQHTAFYDHKGNQKYMDYFKPVSTTNTAMVFAGAVGNLYGVDVAGSVSSIEALNRISKGA